MDLYGIIFNVHKTIQKTGDPTFGQKSVQKTKRQLYEVFHINFQIYKPVQKSGDPTFRQKSVQKTKHWFDEWFCSIYSQSPQNHLKNMQHSF